MDLTRTVLAGTALYAALFLPSASGAIYGFTCIPASGGGCAVNAASQLTVEVTASTIGAANAVSFVFRNTGAIDSVITSIYWDDRTGSANAANQYLNFGTNAVGGGASQGVSYIGSLQSPGNLPRGSTISPAFVEDAEAAPNSKGGTANNGVQEGITAGADALEVRIALLNTRTFSDVLAGIENGTLRIGFHLQGLNCTGFTACQASDPYVNGTSPVPEPGSYVVLSLGLVTVAWSQRRRFSQS